MFSRTVLLSAVLCSLAGCQLDGFGSDEAVGNARKNIIAAGSPNDGTHANVCWMKVQPPPTDEGDERDPFECSCTLVEEKTILTSAICLWYNAEKDVLGDIDIFFGANAEDGPYAIDTAEIYRYFKPELAGRFELGLARLTEAPVGIEPVIVNTTALSSDNVDETLTLVGFGEYNELGASGIRKYAPTTISAVTPQHVLSGDELNTSCGGDGGGPGFMNIGDQEVQVTVTQYQSTCRFNVNRIRVDVYADTFIHPYIDRFSGDCPKDDNCETSGCRTADPDCDPCSWDGTCVEDCPTRDWDCDIGSFVGESCAQDGDCEEGGRCIPAIDDESFTFCSRPCDPATTDQCPDGMECTDLGGGEGECSFLAPSPGSQGFSCSNGAQCRSEICEDQICVNECDPGLGVDACPAEFNCGPSKEVSGKNVCLGVDLSGGGGFCTIAPGSSANRHRNAFAFLALVVAGGLVAMRRRRFKRGADRSRR